MFESRRVTAYARACSDTSGLTDGDTVYSQDSHDVGLVVYGSLHRLQEHQVQLMRAMQVQL
jgi:hypothetical protein